MQATITILAPTRQRIERAAGGKQNYKMNRIKSDRGERILQKQFWIILSEETAWDGQKLGDEPSQLREFPGEDLQPTIMPRQT